MTHVPPRKGETTLPKSERNQQLYRDFLTGNFTKVALSKIYNITAVRVAQIIKKESRRVNS